MTNLPPPASQCVNGCQPLCDECRVRVARIYVGYWKCEQCANETVVAPEKDNLFGVKPLVGTGEP